MLQAVGDPEGKGEATALVPLWLAEQGVKIWMDGRTNRRTEDGQPRSNCSLYCSILATAAGAHRQADCAGGCGGS